MLEMTIVDVVNMKYPGEYDKGNVSFGRDFTGPVFITKWDVPSVPKPSSEELEAMIPELKPQFDLAYLLKAGSAMIMAHLEAVAKERQYQSALHCASYASSTNEQWQQEARAFIKWRDDVWMYAYSELALIQAGDVPVPSVESFMEGLPGISWPS
jgi:hypothetical protein